MAQTLKHYTIDDIKRINQEHGKNFFTLIKAFNSRILPEVYQGARGIFFVSSEQYTPQSPRLYTVRRFDPDSGHCTTYGDFFGYTSATVAKGAAYLIAFHSFKRR